MGTPKPPNQERELQCLCLCTPTRVCRGRTSGSAACRYPPGSLRARASRLPEPVRLRTRGECAPGAGPRGRGLPGAGSGPACAAARPAVPERASERREEAERAPSRPAMLAWTAFSLALSLRLALARSGAERGE